MAGKGEDETKVKKELIKKKGGDIIFGLQVLVRHL